MTAIDLIKALRGGNAGLCDFCKRKADDLLPEEGGAWACRDCIERWEREERGGSDGDS